MYKHVYIYYYKIYFHVVALKALSIWWSITLGVSFCIAQAYAIRMSSNSFVRLNSISGNYFIYDLNVFFSYLF